MTHYGVGLLYIYERRRGPRESRDPGKTFPSPLDRPGIT